MRLKKFKISLLVFSLSLLGCNKGVDVSPCVLDPNNNNAQCAGYKTHEPKKDYVLPIQNMDNYVCLSPDDLEVLLNYAKLNCKAQSK